MDYMVNMMREHVPQETRIHYIITRGGAAPNVVPDFAEAYYYARQPNMRILDGVWERIVNAAKGAALGTGTTMELEVTGAVYNVLPNEYLSGVMNTNLERVGGFTYTPEEAEVRGGDPQDAHRSARRRRSDRRRRCGRCAPAPSTARRPICADVSWNVPTVSMTARDVRARRAGAQLAGDGLRRRHDRREGDDGGGEVDGADDGRSLHRSGAHPKGEGRVRSEARAELRLQDAARGPEAGAGLPEVNARTHATRVLMRSELAPWRRAFTPSHVASGYSRTNDGGGSQRSTPACRSESARVRHVRHRRRLAIVGALTRVAALAKRKGVAVDGAKFADAWRAGYGPSMNRVRTGELPWTKLDALHRMTLDRILGGVQDRRAVRRREGRAQSRLASAAAVAGRRRGADAAEEEVHHRAAVERQHRR